MAKAKKVKVKHASRTDIFNMMRNETNGRIFTVTYTKVDGTERVMNCNTSGAMTAMGYLLVNDMQEKPTKKNPIPKRTKSVDPRTILEFKFAGKVYRPSDK